MFLCQIKDVEITFRYLVLRIIENIHLQIQKKNISIQQKKLQHDSKINLHISLLHLPPPTHSRCCNSSSCAPQSCQQSCQSPSDTQTNDSKYCSNKQTITIWKLQPFSKSVRGPPPTQSNHLKRCRPILSRQPRSESENSLRVVAMVE